MKEEPEEREFLVRESWIEIFPTTLIAVGESAPISFFSMSVFILND